jgi:signal transduction histidine kinase
VLDTLPGFVAVLAPDGAVRFINAQSLVGASLTQEELTGKPLWLTPWWQSDLSAQAQIREACSRAARGERVVLPDMPMQGTGPRTRVDFVVAPARASSGRITQVVASAVDVGTRGAAVDPLTTKDPRKDEFLAMLAHELRGPLAPLRNAAALMRMREQDEPQEAALSALIDRQIQHLSRLIDDLLDASRIDRGKIALVLEPVELRSLLEQVLEAMRPVIESHGRKVALTTTRQPVWIEADPVRITQIVENLLDNAAKFSDVPGAIRIGLEVSEGSARLSVADDGQGIDAELLPRVFDLFTQGARSPDRSQGGLGIGLSLVRNLTALHGGSITAASAGHGRGSEFIVTLPLLRALPAERPPTPPPAAPTTLKRILVVDDNVDAAESMAELLKVKGHDARAVTASTAALAMAPAFEPQVVILDIGLPEIDGLEVAELMRRMPATRDSLLLAVTGYGQPEDRKASLAAGFDHHLVKPVSLRQIEDLIHNAR